MQREESAEQTVDLLAGKFAFRSIEVDFFLDKKLNTVLVNDKCHKLYKTDSILSKKW